MNIYSLTLTFAKEAALRKADAVISEWLSYKLRHKLSVSELWELPKREYPPDTILEFWKVDGPPALRAARLSHPDTRIPGRRWLTEIGWSEHWSVGPATLSLSVRTDETSALIDAPPQVTRPKLVEDLVKNCEFAAYVPGEDLKTVADGDAAEAFRHVVTDESRSYALVLVSASESGSYLADPERLRSLLAGLAEVVVIPSGANTFAIGDVLGNQFRSWGGAVNIIFPAVQSHRRRQAANRKLLPAQIAELQESGIPLESEILHIITHRTNVLHLRKHTSPEHVHAAIVREAIERNRAQVVETGEKARYSAWLEAEVIALEAKNNTSQLTKSEIEDLNLELQQRCEDLQDELDQLRYQYDALRASFEAAKPSPNRADLSNIRDTVQALAVGDAAPEQMLNLVAALYPERVVVLDSALKSARDAVAFKARRKLCEKLFTLVGAYFHEISSGRGDAEARKVFGESYSARESESVENNHRARDLRTFMHKGIPVEMMQHVKIGVKDSAAETIRVHFKWDGQDQKIVIGYCGPHLDFR